MGVTSGNLFIIALAIERERRVIIAVKPLISMCSPCVGEWVEVEIFSFFACTLYLWRVLRLLLSKHKFIIIGIVVTKACVHCAIFYMHYTHAHGDCVIHTTVLLLYRVGSTRMQIS